jgi:hypothetical protein
MTARAVLVAVIGIMIKALLKQHPPGYGTENHPDNGEGIARYEKADYC